MNQQIEVGIIGDYNPSLPSHIATVEALGHAAATLSVSMISSWIPTQSLTKESVDKILKPFHAFCCAPGSPYKSMDGALEAIRFAREHGRPFLGT